MWSKWTHIGGNRGVSETTIPMDNFYNTTFAYNGNEGTSPHYVDYQVDAKGNGAFTWFSTNSPPANATHFSILAIGGGGGCAGTGSNKGAAGGHGGTFWMYGFPIEGLDAVLDIYKLFFVTGHGGSAGANNTTNGGHGGTSGFGVFSNSSSTYDFM